MKDKTSSTEYIFLVLFGLGAIAVFAAEIVFSNPEPNPRETTLYNALELGLSLGFGWILQRIDARKQFQESLKQFAISAYRRITDIEKSVNRIRNTIEKTRMTYPRGKVHELDILRMVAEELENTVNSSIADWTDILGEDLEKKDRIEELQKEVKALKSNQQIPPKNDETIKRLEDLRREIASLRSGLPYILRDDINPSFEYPREGKLSDVVIDHFSKEIKTYSAITIPFISRIEITDDFLSIVNSRRPFSIRTEQNMFTLYTELIDKDNQEIGIASNPFQNIYSNDYLFTIITILGAITKITGTLSLTPPLGSDIKIPSAEIVKISDDKNKEFLLKIPATIHDLAWG